jgi:hypothetical protein
MINSKRIRWDTYGGKRNAYRVLVGKPEGRTLPARPRQNEGTILKHIIKKKDGLTWNGIIWLRIETGACLM